MENSLHEMLASLNEGRILSGTTFANVDCDEVLQARDEEPAFESEWNRCFAILDKEWSDQDISPEVDEMVDEIREQSYMIASDSTEQHDIAHCISEDFEMFARSAVLDITDPFLEALWDAYENETIPSPLTLAES